MVEGETSLEVASFFVLFSQNKDESINGCGYLSKNYLLTNVVLQENLLDLGSDGLGVQLVGEGGHLVQTGGGGEGRAAQPRPHRQGGTLSLMWRRAFLPQRQRPPLCRRP